MADKSPSAFPIQGYVADASGALTGQVAHDPGMTLRDYFVGQALAGLCANPSFAWVDVKKAPGTVVQSANAIADAAMALRSAKENPQP